MIGIWLIQLGTPASPTPKALRKYLREFLSDRRVVDLPWPFRWLLVNFVFVPLRSKKVAKLYQKIWTPHGSPLLSNTIELTRALQARLPNAAVHFSMRYGGPTAAEGFEQFRISKVKRLVVLPLYPQYASASTGTAIEQVMKILKKEWTIPSVEFISSFYNEKFFLDSFEKRIRKTLDTQSIDHLVFSFHGIPEHQLKKAELPHCPADQNYSCCLQPSSERFYCYRSQCVQTALLLASRLSLTKERFTISFQSRLGVRSWIHPYTDEILEDLAKKGVKRVGVVAPSFVSDCLETLEEIAIRSQMAYERILPEGKIVAIPCPNADSDFVEGLANYLKDRSSSSPL